MKVNVISLDNSPSGSIELNDSIFALELRADIIQRVVRWQLAKRQAGTHKTKTISEISGTTAKPYKQKGTGRARQGSLRSAQFRGGSTVFGPVVRSHAHSLPKKVRRLGLKLALSSKCAEGNLIILENEAISVNKTSELSKKLQVLGFDNALIVGGTEVNENFLLAASNIKAIDVLPEHGLNVYDILRRKKLVLTQAAVKQLQERLA